MLSLKDRHRSAVSISIEIEEVGGQPVSAQTIRRTLHQIGVHGCHPRRKLLLKTIIKKASKKFAEDMSTKHTDYWNQVLWSDEMKINLFGLVGFKHVWQQPGEEYKDVCHAHSQAWWWECHGLRLHECCRCWRVIFHWGKHELQHVLWNTAAEHDPFPPETGSQGSVPAWQWLQTHLQDDHCFTEEAEGKTGKTDPQAEGGGVQSLKYLPAPRRCHGGIEEHSSGYLWSSGKLHAQESKGSSR